MAGGRITGITIELNADANGFQKSIKKIDGSLRQTQASLKDVNKLLRFNPGNTELLTQKQKYLKKAVDETREKLKDLRKAAEKVTPESIGEEKYDALQREIVETESKLGNLEKKYKNFGSVGAQKIKAVGDKMKALGDGMKDVGGKLTKYVTGPIAALGAGSMAAWKEVDNALDIVTKKTGASGDALAEMQQQVRDIATSMPTTFEDAGTAIGEVNTRFGLTGDALKDLSEDFLKFASINDTDVNNSIDTIQSAMAAFNTEVEKAPAVLDPFTAAGQQTGVPIEALAESVKKNATARQEVGFCREDSVMFLSELDKSGADSQTVLAGLKGALKNATKAGKPMNEALHDIQDSLKNAASDTEAAQLATELFGSKAGAAIAEYVRTGQLDFESLGVSMEEYAGLVSQTYEETQDPMDELTTAMNEMKDLGYEIAESAAPIITEAMSVLRDVIKDLKEKWDGLTPAQQEAVVQFALAAAAIGPVLVILGQVIGVIGAIARAAPVMGAALAALSGPGGIVIGIIAAVIAIGVLLGQHWDQVCAWANNLKEKVVGAISDMKQKVSDSIEGVKAKFQEMKDKVSNIMNMVKTDISNKIQAAKDKVTSVVNGMKSSVTNTISGMKSSVTNTISGMKSSVTNTISGMKSAISSTFDSIKSGITNKINAAKDAVSNAISAIKGILSGSISFPHITLPHFTVTGSPPFGLGGHGSPPHISVEWYAKAMDKPYILDGATIFGAMGGQLLGGGEAGREVVMGEEMFNQMTNMSRVETRLASIEGLLSQYLPAGQRIIMDSGELVGVVNRGLGGLYG